MSGRELLKKLISATGLPKDSAERELLRLIENAHIDIDNLTLGDLRMVMAEYLQDVLLQAKRENSTPH